MGQREPGIIPAAEWGEKPRETVTVKPAASRISQIRKALLPDRCHHRGRSAKCKGLLRPAAIGSRAFLFAKPGGAAAASFHRGPEFKPLRPRFLGKFAIEAFA